MRRNVAKNAAKTVLTDEEKKAVRAGASRAWYADLPGSVADLSGAALDYGAEGLARLLPSDLAGYDIPKSLGIRKFQQAMRNPAGGSKQLEKFGEQVGYIPPTTGTEMEERARLLAGLVDPIPGVPVGSVKQTQAFTSPAVKAVSEIKQNKMPANQWISQMKSRGVKQDELTWTGVEDWLKSQDKSVTKQDLDEYLEANQIQVQEVVKGTADQSAKDRVIRMEVADDLNVLMDNDEYLYENQDVVGPLIDRYQTGDETVVEQLDDFFWGYRDVDTGESAITSLKKKNIEYFDQNPREFERKAGGSTKYEQYTLPGGEMYRELLLTLPSRIDPRRKRLQELSGKKREELTDAARQERLDLLDLRRTGQFKDTQDFVSGHYDEPNIVAHIRFNERVDAKGNKVLFIEEIQSDWAQVGRKKGFMPTEAEKIEASNKIKELRKQQQELALKYEETKDPIYNEQWQKIEDQIPALGRLAVVSDTGSTSRVPQAPFVMDTNQWTSLALKRMVRWATDNDFDQIAWTTGKQQAKRYDLSKQLDAVNVKRSVSDDGYVITGEKDGVQQSASRRIQSLDQLDDVIGKELADKARTDLAKLDDPGGQVTEYDGVTYRGVDLEVGGEGMGAFYDKILVDRAKKLGKQYGSKVEKGDIGITNFDVPRSYGISPDDNGTFKIVPESTETTPEGDFIIGEPTHRYIKTLERAQKILKQLEKLPTEEVWTMNLTDKLKKAAKDGLPYYVALPPIVAGVASQQAEASEVKKPAVQVKSNRIMEEAMP